MSSLTSMQPEAQAQEQARRDFVIGIFGLLKGLSVHDIRNEALFRPFQQFESSLKQFAVMLPTGATSLELRYYENLLWIGGSKVAAHFSVTEALKFVIESLEISMIESITFAFDAPTEDLENFFSHWALHNSVNGKPKALHAANRSIQILHSDPDKANLRLKNKQLLMSPQYALKHYYLLKRHTEKFFMEIKENRVISQRHLRRELMEFLEILNVSPYQLVALSLIRHKPNTEDSGFSSIVSQAIATSLLSMALARELSFPIRDQLNLGIIGLLYNVGMLGTAAAAALKDDRLTPAEYKKVIEAQASGVHKLLIMQGSSRPVLERLLLIFEYAHQNSTASIELTLESRLLKLVSQYVALTSERPFREAYTPSEAVRLLGSKAAIGADKGDLDPILYYLFVRFLGGHPVGSLVALSNHQRAVIFRPSGDKLGVPMLKLLISDTEERAKLIDLAHMPEVHISKILDPKREGVSVTGYFFE